MRHRVSDGRVRYAGRGHRKMRRNATATVGWREGSESRRRQWQREGLRGSVPAECGAAEGDGETRSKRQAVAFRFPPARATRESPSKWKGSATLQALEYLTAGPARVVGNVSR